MTNIEIVAGMLGFLLLFSTGIFCIRASYYNIDSFFQHDRVEGFDKVLGRTITRMIYFIIGAFFVGGGIGVLLTMLGGFVQ